MRLRGVIAAGVLAGAVGVSVACTKDPPGEVVLSFQTDMSVPKDVSAVVLSITSSGRTLFEEQYNVGPTGVKLPSTFGVVEGEKDEPVTIKLIALKGTKPVVLREVVTKIPKGRVAGMKMPIEWLCAGESSVKGEIRQAAENQCPAGQTCSAGSCVPSDSFPLDDPYDAKNVFGGGDDKGQGGSCFSTESCFSAVQTVAVTPVDDGSACAFTLDGVRNVALEPEDRATGIGTGPNGTGPFLVPLDQGKSGFELQGSRVTLPRAVCTRIAKGIAGTSERLRVYATRSCSPKTNRTPTCGAWSAVTKPTPTEDAGTAAEGGNPNWKSVPVRKPRSLRVAGPPNARRLYFVVDEGTGSKVLSCDAASCSEAGLRCEASFTSQIGVISPFQRTNTDPVAAIYAINRAQAVEVADTSSACAVGKPVAFPGAPPLMWDLVALEKELLLMGDNQLGSCSMSALDKCDVVRPIRSFGAPAPGKLSAGNGVAYIHGTEVGGCTTSACSTTTSKDVAVDNATPLAIVADSPLYYWIQGSVGGSTVVRDCPTSPECRGADRTEAGVYFDLAVNSQYVYVATSTGLSRIRQLQQGEPPGPKRPESVDSSSPYNEVKVDGDVAYYLSDTAVVRFRDGQ
ncbi:MAG: hypothetical protein IPK71_36050 [Myxococcales bacterium]|nr:hypothetical protein [Myxococcales bacterium]